jgi:uncharacterized protein (DUF1330 family)
VFIEPNPEQIKTLLDSESTGPVVMLNLLKFKPGDGEATYMHYGEGVFPLLAKVGARLLWQGRADSVVIGDVDADGWDAVALVEYPSRSAFLEMVGSPEYQAIADRRTKALDDSRLIACTGSLAGLTAPIDP